MKFFKNLCLNISTMSRIFFKFKTSFQFRTQIITEKFTMERKYLNIIIFQNLKKYIFASPEKLKK